MSKANEYVHAEAYCLMQYHCSDCGKHEILWNSRDGVTPMVIPCSNCNGDMAHVRWEEDSRDPHHVPWKGQRVFVDLTKERAKAWAETRFEQAKGTKYEIPPHQHDEWVTAFVRDYLERGEPDIRVVGEDWNGPPGKKMMPHA